MKTWHFENAFVAFVLSLTILATGGRPIEWIGALAVYCGFCHASIAERMREREAARTVPSVECYRLATVFFLGKEACWVVYFVALHAWSALVGCAIFMAYPLWRKAWRRWHPLPIEPAPWATPGGRSIEHESKLACRVTVCRVPIDESDDEAETP